MPHLEHDAKLLSPKAKFSRSRLALYSGLTAAVGIIVVVAIFAATGSLALEAESGTLSGPATITTVASASGGKAVQFGSGATPTPTPTPSGNCTPNPAVTPGFPNNCNTGVPAGTTLTAYTGSSTISGTVDGKILNGGFNVTGTATIKNSKIIGSITSTGNLTLTDDEIVGDNTDETNSLIFGSNITARRINVHDGKANFQCQDSGCNIYDSYFHDPYLIQAYHYDVIGSNGVNGMILDHNTLQCKFSGQAPGATGGCSADLGFFGDFGVIQNITVNNNLFMASSDPGYCVITNASKPGKAYPTGKNLVWTNNTFQRGSNGKCGYYGPVDNWVGGNGNVWTGNKWDDGAALNE